ncbi:hypothetical protein ERO13_D10G126950v2 [Gossypium hirsutum]|nr:hypothetical protein ERO13_D10G126950v2 [Gossypium hirsutum]
MDFSSTIVNKASSSSSICLISLEPKTQAQNHSFSTSMEYPESTKAHSSSPLNTFNLLLPVLFLQSPLRFHGLLLYCLKPRTLISHRGNSVEILQQGSRASEQLHLRCL